MKPVAIAVIAASLALAAPVAAHDVHTTDAVYNHDHGRHFSINSLSSWEDGDARYRIKGDEIIIRAIDDRTQEVRVTADIELFVNGENVRLTTAQRARLKEWYDLTYQIRDQAKLIMKEGLKVGIKGAGLGLKAIGGLVKMLVTDYDEEEFEAYMEAEGEKIEAYAEVLEEKAEVVEDMAERWEDIGDNLVRDVPELNRLDWLR